MAKVMTNKIKRIYIEITNICNLTCSFCSTHHRENKMLSLDEFSSIIQDVKQYTKYILVHTVLKAVQLLLRYQSPSQSLAWLP